MRVALVQASYEGRSQRIYIKDEKTLMKQGTADMIAEVILIIEYVAG